MYGRALCSWFWWHLLNPAGKLNLQGWMAGPLFLVYKAGSFTLQDCSARKLYGRALCSCFWLHVLNPTGKLNLQGWMAGPLFPVWSVATFVPFRYRFRRYERGHGAGQIIVILPAPFPCCPSLLLTQLSTCTYDGSIFVTECLRLYSGFNLTLWTTFYKPKDQRRNNER